MKKIGVMTYQNAINVGALLQTYALNRYLNSKSNVYCETINYKCKKIDSSYNLIKLNLKEPKTVINSFLGFPNNFIRKIKFKKFKNNIQLSNKSYSNKNIKETNKIYNIFITGSDQVWNYNLNNDLNYFLKFVSDDNIRASYAASFGNISVIKDNKSNIDEELRKYKVVSVREKSAVEELKKVNNLKSTCVLDPTFLLSKNEWNEICIPQKHCKDYILLYVLHEESAYKIAEKIKQKTGFEIYIINQSYKKRINGRYFHNVGPIDFLNLIKNSKYVVTDSFHGTALSIIFRKNLKVVLKNENIFLNDRLTSILDIFNLNECIVSNDTPLNELISNVNYTKSEDVIEKEINYSKKIIDKIIE